jgi:hypothetical protein
MLMKFLVWPGIARALNSWPKADPSGSGIPAAIGGAGKGYANAKEEPIALAVKHVYSAAHPMEGRSQVVIR